MTRVEEVEELPYTVSNNDKLYIRRVGIHVKTWYLLPRAMRRRGIWINRSTGGHMWDRHETHPRQTMSTLTSSFPVGLDMAFRF